MPDWLETAESTRRRPRPDAVSFIIAQWRESPAVLSLGNADLEKRDNSVIGANNRDCILLYITMPVKENLKLEAHIDHALRKEEFHSLEDFLQKNSSSQKCSKELLLKLDQLISRELDKKDIRNVSLLLNVIYKCSKCRISRGEEWLTTAISQGLVEKMVAWYEKIRNILICAGSARKEALLTLTEDYFDVLMAVHDHNSEGKIQILGNFISKTCCLVADASIGTFIKQEAVRKLNLMLDTVPREARKKLIFTKEMMATMSAMGKQILDAGDYDLQVAITEALCRMTSEAERKELASQWFPMEFITTTFKGIKDSEFETDCRKFLNLVNGMLGDKRRVFTYPCISAHLDHHQFQTPCDEKLEDFWIDFNVGTQSISFYVSADDSNESNQWETVCITESEVDMYNVDEINNRTLLTVRLTTSVTVGRLKGSEIRIYFDLALAIPDVVKKVFGTSKCKGFVKKQTISVAKTAVHIVFDDPSGSQILIPESQGSFTSSREVIDTSDVGKTKQALLSTPSLNQQFCKENSCKELDKLVTPGRKVSEASINISVACGLNKGNSSASRKSATERGRKKTPLEMTASSKRSTPPIRNMTDYTRHAKQIASVKQTVTASDKGTVHSNKKEGSISKGDEQTEMVPDTQFTTGNNSVLLPGLSEKSLGVNKRMSTRLKEKISVAGGYISNKDKAYDIADKPQTRSVVEHKMAAQNPKAKVISNQKAKAQALDPCKSTKQENHRTEVKERTSEQQTCNNSFSNTETSFNKNIQRSRINLLPEKPEIERTKSDITEVEKSKISKYVTKGKDTEKNMNEKAKCKDAAKTLVSNIGNKYSKEAVTRKQEYASFRENLKKNSKQTNKEKSQSKNTKKGSKQSNVDIAVNDWDDVYSFYSKGGDEPTIELGGSSVFTSNKIINFEISSTRTSSIKNSKSKNESEQKLGNPHKHLFSDTDTDRGGDDSKTDISWLQNIGSKKKQNIVGYSRQKQDSRPKKKTVSCKAAAGIFKQSRKQTAKQHKELSDIGLGKKDAEETCKQSKFKCPQRATGKRKHSTESFGSQSESEEELKPPSSKQTPKHLQGLLTTMQKMKNVEYPSPSKMHKKLSKMGEETVSNTVSVFKMPPSPACSSPGSVDQIRSEQYESDPELPTRHSTTAHSSPSLSASPLEKQTPKESMNISLDLKKVNKQWTELSDKSASKQFTHKTVKLDVGMAVQEQLSPAYSPLTQDVGILDYSTVSGLNVLEVTGNEYNDQNGKICSPVTKTRKTGVHTFKKKTDSNCPSFYSGSSTKRTSSCDMSCVNMHQSGPTLDDTMSYIKRINKQRSHYADMSTKGIDHEIKHKKIKLCPRKLFPSPDMQVPREHLSNVSENNASTAATDTWDGSSSDVGMMCKQISNEFTRKIQNRSRKMEFFTKQSLKSVQKHMTLVDDQVRECRIMRLEKFHQTILEEIEGFEKDSQALKQMEKEFVNFWRQQTQVLSLYHKNEQRRIHCLKSSFEMNVSNSTDFEEKIFNSEINTLKENMKAVQERLLKEMQEEELLSVRRGLQSLFMPSTGPF
ncbi:synaptonemal complex protein 2 isoform X3 [Hyla sarda]|uniref:synaptonemal complex protein 2 isoform X3 n=1 Tax=Hyla sarda TaxID=327740 RepID=UPI0024C3CC3A|nr:synaptonemal complex protein 2 isoform X3 [Hyla sarda]